MTATGNNFISFYVLLYLFIYCLLLVPMPVRLFFHTYGVRMLISNAMNSMPRAFMTLTESKDADVVISICTLHLRYDLPLKGDGLVHSLFRHQRG